MFWQLQYEFVFSEKTAGEWVRNFVRSAPTGITTFRELVDHMASKRSEVADAIVLLNRCKGRRYPSLLDHESLKLLKPFAAIQREAWVVSKGHKYNAYLEWSVRQVERVLVEVGQSSPILAPRDARRFVEQYMVPAYG